MRMKPEHVWDSFIIWTLIQQHEKKSLVVVVPHTGEQKHRFTLLMEERNKEVILDGQEEIAHYCDKCMRVWEDGENNLRMFLCLLFGRRN